VPLGMWLRGNRGGQHGLISPHPYFLLPSCLTGNRRLEVSGSLPACTPPCCWFPNQLWSQDSEEGVSRVRAKRTAAARRGRQIAPKPISPFNPRPATCRAASPSILVNGFDFARPPCLVEPWLERPIQAQECVPALARDRLHPVVFLPIWGFRTEIDVDGTIRIRD
jgi:hypothetical protein